MLTEKVAIRINSEAELLELNHFVSTLGYEPQTSWNNMIMSYYALDEVGFYMVLEPGLLDADLYTHSGVGTKHIFNNLVDFKDYAITTILGPRATEDPWFDPNGRAMQLDGKEYIVLARLSRATSPYIIVMPGDEFKFRDTTILEASIVNGDTVINTIEYKVFNFLD